MKIKFTKSNYEQIVLFIMMRRGHLLLSWRLARGGTPVYGYTVFWVLSDARTRLDGFDATLSWETILVS